MSIQAGSPVTFSGKLIIPSSITTQYGEDAHKKLAQQLKPYQQAIANLPDDVLVNAFVSSDEETDTVARLLVPAGKGKKDLEQLETEETEYGVSHPVHLGVRYQDEFGEPVTTDTLAMAENNRWDSWMKDGLNHPRITITEVLARLKAALTTRDANKTELDKADVKTEPGSSSNGYGSKGFKDWGGLG